MAFIKELAPDQEEPPDAEVPCVFHGIEPEPKNGILCGECLHIFQSPDELIEVWNNMVISNGLGVKHLKYDADEIPFCPFCGHDWACKHGEY